MTWGALSPSYQKSHEAAIAHNRYWRAREKADYEAMILGPRLEGRWLVIPSSWYDAEAVTFWKRLGARYNTGDPEDRIWILDTQRARWKGKRYTPTAWLRSVRNRYYELHGLVDPAEGCDD